MRRQHHTKPDFTPLTEARLIVFFHQTVNQANRKKQKQRFYFSNYCNSQSDMLFLPNKTSNRQSNEKQSHFSF